MDVSKDIWLFRIIHYKNLSYILKHGFCTKDSPKADPNYISIGDPLLIKSRRIHDVLVNPPNGTLGEYIPFYFGSRSPMLYNIYKGYGVKQFPQEEIIYLCCKLQDIIESEYEWCFTDGHAKTKTTEFFNNINYLERINKQDVDATYWIANEKDKDIRRKKQAEFLVKSELNANFISIIVTYNENMKNIVTELVKNTNLNIKVGYRASFYY